MVTDEDIDNLIHRQGKTRIYIYTDTHV